MNNKFIFDVDGTLTPSRGKMDYNFKAFFNTFCLVNDVYLVTGSDKPKTIEQISEGTYNLCKRVYQCSGSDVWDAETVASTKVCLVCAQVIILNNAVAWLTLVL